MARPRKQTYTLEMYLKKIQEGDICNDADVQRNFVWKADQINELTVTVLTDDYIPPIILGEEPNSQLHVIDGGNRSGALISVRHLNYKITSSIENSIITYKKKVVTEDGIVWEDATFDIKGKTFEQFPDELKKKFDEYQIETVIHEDCDMKRISQLIKRYNNHTAMSVSQKAFTYIENYAKDIRKILRNTFFTECGGYTEKERSNGTVERVVIETMMCMNHVNEWKKQTKQISNYLNKNATKEDFDKLNNNLTRLSNVVGDEFKSLFTSKNSFIWLTLFNKFTELSMEDFRFVEFLRAFNDELKDKKVDGVAFSELDDKRNTKDKTMIISKLNTLESLMVEFLKEKESQEKKEILSIVQDCVSEEKTEDDVEFYETLLEDYSVEVDNESKLLDKINKPSLVSIICYACDKENDVLLARWIVDYFKKEDTYKLDQKENYLHMKRDFDEFVKINEAEVL